MQAMQYKVGLPADYEMGIIRDRVLNNGSKTDGFTDLLFKAYLITDKSSGDLQNSYSPLYVWKQTEGMNKFIFDGFFDNIIGSFGWQNIEIGVTQTVNLSESFPKSKYVLEEYHDIPEAAALNGFEFKAESYDDMLGQVTIYNPDKWKYATFSFFENRPQDTDKKIYTILHLSLDK
ncbi:DUF4865 family protein [Xylocopilactobacillus apicola]|uniref:DUF4865 domain-containing protein n=1 Tax=Xylocopilactobacillus apicola TaxID=2932184 RepID=A0AAU9DV81_9LACO|nr:DUF4865 family protein [Xylocopilactobacillus apicola]BDR57783.1 DUF4865 domain-containing protein [Xylocopilactobacillus apicola]